MEYINACHLIIMVMGLKLYSLSLHFKKENKDLVYSSKLGYLENLTTKGRVLLIIGLVLSVGGAFIGTKMWLVQLGLY